MICLHLLCRVGVRVVQMPHFCPSEEPCLLLKQKLDSSKHFLNPFRVKDKKPLRVWGSCQGLPTSVASRSRRALHLSCSFVAAGNTASIPPLAAWVISKNTLVINLGDLGTVLVFAPFFFFNVENPKAKVSPKVLIKNKYRLISDASKTAPS